ncbi:MAG: protein kinase [Candidatus Ozemobacteraceae bacterium]
MEIAAFLLTSVSGNILLNAIGGVLGDISREEIAAHWNRFDLGHDDIEKALTVAYRKTFTCIELMLTPPGALSRLFTRFCKTSPEKVQARIFTEKILLPFLKRMEADPGNVNEKRSGFDPGKGNGNENGNGKGNEKGSLFDPGNANGKRSAFDAGKADEKRSAAVSENASEKRLAFLTGGAEMCRFFRSHPEKVLSWPELVKSFPAGTTPFHAAVEAALPHQRSRATFHLVSAILFSGNDLAEAPNVRKELDSASRLLLTKIQAVGREAARKIFPTSPASEARFYDLLRERHLFLTGLTFFLEEEIRVKPSVAAHLREMGERETKLARAKAENREGAEHEGAPCETFDREAAHRELLQNLEALRTEVHDAESRIVARQVKNIPVRALEMDLLELRNSLAPLEQQFARLDMLSRRFEGWRELSLQMGEQRELFVEAFGGVAERLDEIAGYLEKQSGVLTTIGDGITNLRSDIGSVKSDIGSVTSDIGSVKSDIGAVKQDTNELKTALGELLTIKTWERIEKKYEILNTIGHGQFGIVFKVQAKSGGEIRSLKVLRSDAGLDADVKRRFMNEACTAYELDHPNIVRVHDVDPIGGFFEMDFLEGKTLRDALRTHPGGLSEESFLHITHHLLDGLEYLHRDRHLAHRDLKPENIMLVPDETGKAVLTDLGAITHLDIIQETLGHGLAGTAIYMAPEQFEGEKSPRIDIYAFGVLMYEMACGVPPFSGGNFLEIRRRHTVEAPEPPSTRCRYLDGGLESVILTCLAKRPEERFDSIADIREALGSRTGESERTRRDRQRREEVLLDALQLAWSAGEKSEEAEAFIENKCRELGLDQARLRELEVIVVSRPETAARIDSRKAKLVEEKRRTIVALPGQGTAGGGSNIGDIGNIGSNSIAGSNSNIGSNGIAGSNSNIGIIGKNSTVSSNGSNNSTSGGVGQVLSPDAFSAQNAHRLRESSRFGRGRVFQALLTFDRRMLIVASSTGVHFYGAEQLLLIRTVGQGSWISSIALSPDGRFLAGACKDGVIRIWEVPTGKETARCEGHEGEVTSVAFSMDGVHLVSGGWDGTVRLWKADSGCALKKILAHGMSVTAVAVSIDGRFFSSASWDGTLKLFESESCAEKRVFSGHSGVVHTVTFVDDGTHLFSGGGDKTARLWSLETGKEVICFSGHTGPVTAVCAAFGGRFLLTASGDRTVRVWNPMSGEEMTRFTGHTQPVQSVAVSSNSRFVVSGGAEGAVIIWDTSTGNRLQTLEGHFPQIRAVALSSDQRFLVSGALDGGLHVWDFSTGKLVRRLDGHSGPVNAVVFSREGNLLVSGGGDRTIRLWNIVTGAETRKITGHGDWVNTVALSSDGRLLISGSNDGTVRFWDVTNGKERQKCDGHQGRVNSVAITPDGSICASGGRDGTVRFWDTATGEEVRRIEGLLSGVTSLAISADGKFLIAGSGDGLVHIRGFATGKELKRFSGHQGSVTSIFADFDGERRMIISGGMDKSVRIWDFSAGREIRKLDGHGDLVNGVLATPDGAAILSAGWDGTIRVWRLGA